MRWILPLLLAAPVACTGPQPVPPPAADVNVHQTMALHDVAQAARTLAGTYGTRNVLVAFDLDNTLLAMQGELGSDQWYDWQKAIGTADRCDDRLVADRLAAQGALYHVGAMRPTEPGLPELIGHLQEDGHPVMLITARGSDFRLQTFRELRRNHLSFMETAPGPYRGLAKPVLLDPDGRPVLYEDGALLLAGQHKGHMLLALFDHLGLPYPQAVVFADDKDYNVAAVAEALDQARVRGELFRYDRELDRVESLDEAQVVADWARLVPALETVEQIMGTANFDLPPHRQPTGCRP